MLEKEIVDREQAEFLARDQEAKIQQILAGLPIGILLVDAEKKTISDVNPAAQSMINAEKEEIVGQLCHTFMCDAEKKSCP